MYRRVFTAVVDTHRPIVLQFNVHHCLEDAILDPVCNVGIAHLIVEMVIDSACCRGVGGIVEVGLVALFQLPVERELRDCIRCE